MERVKLTFVRQEGIDITAIAFLTLELLEVFDSQEQIEQKFIEAVTKWIEETEEGKSLWYDSCEDINIGDIANNYPIEDSLANCLEDVGIRFIDVETVNTQEVIPFDTVLAHPEIDE